MFFLLNSGKMNKMKIGIKNKRGITVVELVVVIAIVTILAAIVLVNTMVHIKNAKNSAIKQNLYTIKLYASKYFIKNGTFEGFDKESEFIVPKTAIEKILGSGHSGTGVIFHVDKNSYCIQTQLYGYIYYCLDGNGAEGMGFCGLTGASGTTELTRCFAEQ